MSQSLRAIKRFRIRELSNPQKHLLTSPSTAASANPKLSPDLSSSRTSATLLNPFIPHKNPSSGRWAPPRYSLRRQAELIKHARASNTLHLLPPSPKMTPQLLLLAATTTTTTVDGVSTAANSSSGSGGASGLMMKKEEDTSLQGRGVEEVQQQEQQGEEQEGSTWLRREREDTRSVEWIGTVRQHRVAGADIGARLYAGKKRMFKGHKWERERERRETRTKILLRDMDKRIQRFKQYRAKGKPLPLARRSSVLKKTEKLPF